MVVEFSANRRGGEDLAPASVDKETGKRKLGKQHPGGRYSNPSQVVVDRFGEVNVLSTDKFGAVRNLERSRSDVDDNIEEYSTGLCAPLEYYTHSRKRYGSAFGDDSAWRTCAGELEFQGAARSCPSDPSSHSSIPISCTLDLHASRTSTGSDAGPPVKRLCPAPANHRNAQKTHREPNILSRNGVVDLRRAEHNASGQGLRAKLFLKPRYSVDPNRTGLLPMPTARLKNIARNTTLTSAAMESESLGSARYYGDSNDHNSPRFNYKFASATLEACLLERMEARQRVQNATHEPERCSHVISPEDLVWGSVKHYIGMVLDRETNSLLGTAVLFMPPESRQGSHAATAPKSAWVTCVQAVEGRTEVVIKNSRGGMHVAHLMLTSPALGLALFSVDVWQGTFALAFLSRVSGPASLPHRLFVDVDRSDRVYVIGYEEPWESEFATIADARVRPGRIVDAGRHTIVEIDFTTGQLGGSIYCPAGFRGGLVVRADGLLAGVVTGELLWRHKTSIDISSAYNVYALLEEL